MAFLTLYSTNPDFSFLIKKNPASGMMVKDMRLGRAFGWFFESSYNVFFRDAENEVSYKTTPDESFEYVNTSRYNSMMFVINAINDFFSNSMKKQDEKDVAGFEHTFFINMANVRGTKFLYIFNEYFPDFNIVCEEVANKNYRITITTKRTLRELLNYVMLFAVFNVIRNEGRHCEMFEISDVVVEKYLRCLTVIDAPYFVRYSFKVSMLRGAKLFNKYKDMLSKDGIELVIGDTAIQRLNAVSSRLTMNNSVIDIGCGDGFYALAIAKKLLGKPYYAIDIDEKCRESVKRKAKIKQIDNITVLDNFQTFVDFEAKAEVYDALMVEVIEHMEIDAATDLAKQVLSQPQIKMLLVTTPNKDFNQFYQFEDDELRHEDHKFEFTAQEFAEWVKKVTPENYTAKLFDIGDRVNGHATTLGAWFRKVDLIDKAEITYTTIVSDGEKSHIEVGGNICPSSPNCSPNSPSCSTVLSPLIKPLQLLWWLMLGRKIRGRTVI